VYSGSCIFSFTFSVSVQGTIRSVVHVGVGIMRTPHKAESSRLVRVLLRSSEYLFFHVTRFSPCFFDLVLFLPFHSFSLSVGRSCDYCSMHGIVGVGKLERIVGRF